MYGKKIIFYAALWLFVQFGSSCASQEVAARLDTRKQDPGFIKKDGVCKLDYILAMMDVAGGRVPRCGDFPYTVLVLPSSDSYKIVCTGSIISSTATLTIGHCIAKNYLMYAGNSRYLYREDFRPPTQIRQSNNSITYIPQNITKHDIRLIFLKEPWRKSIYVNKVELDDNKKKGRLSCIVTGYGYYNSTYRNCYVGRAIMQKIPTTWDCPKTQRMSETWVCTNDTLAKGMCTSDTGSPAVCRTGGGIWRMVYMFGGVPYVPGKPPIACRPPHIGNMYVRISDYVDWVKKNVPDLKKPLAPDDIKQYPYPPVYRELERPTTTKRPKTRMSGCFPLQHSLSTVGFSLLSLALKNWLESNVSS